MRENEHVCECACARTEASLLGTYLSNSHTHTLDEGPWNFQHHQGSHQTIQTNQRTAPLTVQRAKISLRHSDLDDQKNIKIQFDIFSQDIFDNILN